MLVLAATNSTTSVEKEESKTDKDDKRLPNVSSTVTRKKRDTKSRSAANSLIIIDAPKGIILMSQYIHYDMNSTHSLSKVL